MGRAMPTFASWTQIKGKSTASYDADKLGTPAKRSNPYGPREGMPGGWPLDLERSPPPPRDPPRERDLLWRLPPSPSPQEPKTDLISSGSTRPKQWSPS